MGAVHRMVFRPLNLITISSGNWKMFTGAATLTGTIHLKRRTRVTADNTIIFYDES